MSDNLVEPSGNSKKIKTVLMVIGSLALIGFGAGGVMYGMRLKPEWFGIKNQSVQNNQKEVDSLVAEIQKIIELPAGETPTLATVTDVNKVKDQKFFKNAKEGDKVLVYATAKKAFLYRASEKKIIEVGVVDITQQANLSGTPRPNISPSLAPLSPTLSPKPTVSVNPTSTPSLTPAL